LASSKSPYDSGYDHGCDEAGISDPSEQYINQPEKGPAYHTSEFMDGYYAGLNSCGPNQSYSEDKYDGSDNYDSGSESYQSTPNTSSKTLEDYCNQYYGMLGLSQPCDNYVRGNELQGPGAAFVVCNLIKLGLVSTTGPLATILLSVPCG
jgi:hypothetical protein